MSSNYSMYLTFDGGAYVIPFAVLPEKIEIATGTNIDSVNLADLGEVIVRQGRPAITISFSSFFPAKRFYGISNSQITDPYLIVSQLQKLMETNKPAYFISTACSINMYVLIESFEYEERGGDPNTIYYTIKLREYREVQARSISLTANNSYAPQYTGAMTNVTGVTFYEPDTTIIRRSAGARVDNTQIPSTYTVQNDWETLFDIAGKIYGNPDRMHDIQQANYSQLYYSPTLKKGMVLVIPQ